MNAKKLVTFGFVMFGCGVGAMMARVVTLEPINVEIAKIVKPINNVKTQAEMVLTSAILNDKRAVEFALEIAVAKLGKIAAGLKAQLAYSYPESLNSVPEVKLSAKLSAKNGNMVLVLKNLGLEGERLDAFFADPKKSIVELSKEFLENYGDAASISVNVKDVKRDKSNHYVSETFEVKLIMDLTKLPKNTPATSVPLRELDLLVGLNLEEGMELSGNVIANTGYTGFQPDQQGLKEIIEKLEKKDQKTLEQIGSVAGYVESIMEQATHEPKP